MPKLSVRRVQGTGDHGENTYRMKYEINTNALEFSSIQVRITDEDAVGNNCIFEKTYVRGQTALNHTISAPASRDHLLLVHLLVDNEEKETTWFFFGEKERIDVVKSEDLQKGILRVTIRNASQSRDISFRQGDISIPLRPHDRGRAAYELPFPGFILGRGCEASFVVPFGDDVTYGALRFDSKIGARFDIHEVMA